MSHKLSLSWLENFLEEACESLRGNMDASEFVMNLNQYSEASAQPGLAVSKILSLIVKRPQFNEQKEIAKHLLSLASKANTENKILSKYQQLKSALMSELLTGKVRVKYNENEKVEAGI